jgi:3-methyladenine DNA glycosylase AlkD
MDPVIGQVRRELGAIADPAIRQSARRFFKEEVRCYGTKTAAVIAIAKKYWKEVKGRPKAEIFALCEELYRSGYMEESFIVSEWAHALSREYEPADLWSSGAGSTPTSPTGPHATGSATTRWGTSSNGILRVLKS